MNLLMIGKTTTEVAFALLDSIHKSKPITKIVSSGRPDSATFAVRWAVKNKIPRALVPCDDTALLKEKVDLVVYFTLDERDKKLLYNSEQKKIRSYCPK